MAAVTGDRIILTDSTGQVIGDSKGELLAGDAHTQRIFQILQGRTIDQNLGEPTVLITAQDRPSVYVYITSEASNESGGAVFLGEVNRQVLLAVVVASIVGLLLMLFFSRSILRPVEELTAAARTLEKGDLSQRVVVRSRDEIGQLAHAFNAMADGISQQEQLRRNMVNDVAHELRTPIANVRGYLEAMRDGVVEPTPAVINSLHEEAMLLTRLLDDLQDLAQAEAGQLSLQREPTPVEDVMQRSVRQLRVRAQDKDLNITCQTPADLPLVDIDGERIGQVLRNLLSNAINYTPPGGRIAVSARGENRHVAISVSDTGPGISPEYLPFIFDRFYRVDSSRTRATGGSGLGLAIAKQLIEAHGGEMLAQSTPGQGTTITFTLPISDVQLSAV